MVVQEELEKLSIRYLSVDLGVVDLPEAIAESQRHQLGTNLLKYGFELLDDKKSILIEKIKNVVT
ncbi:hypothetical protein GCM10027051_11550 [Niabella terrae]